jgi:hypothetical protein
VPDAGLSWLPSFGWKQLGETIPAAGEHETADADWEPNAHVASSAATVRRKSFLLITA